MPVEFAEKWQADQPQLIASGAAAQPHLTGLSRDLLYEQMRRGNLSYVKVGRRRLNTRQHLEQFLGLP